MLGRSVVLFLATCSFMWILYVGYTLVEGAQPPLPENVFSFAEDTILVVHKPKELDLNYGSIARIYSNDFYKLLLNNPERVQHFYFSLSKSIVLLERSKPWTSEIIKNLTSKLHLSASISTSKELSLSNGWSGRFHGKYLIFYQGEWSPSKSSIADWKYMDKKSSVSLIYNVNTPKYEISDVYFLKNQVVKTISQSNKTALPLVEDQQLFQEIIPADFTVYNFFQTDLAKQQQNQNSVVFEWMNYGMTYLVYQGDTCLITDFKEGQDPLLILSDKSYAQVSVKNKQALLKRTRIPFVSSSQIHLEVFNNWVLFSSSQSCINKVIGAYETGNTVAQSQSLKTKFFANSPRKVSLRFISKDMELTKSFLSGVMHKTEQIFNKTSNQITNENQLNQLTPIRLDDKLVELIQIPNTSQLLAITQSNTLYVIGSKGIIWNKNLGSQLKGKPVFIGNGIFLACEDKVWGLDKNGGNLTGFPLEKGKVQSELLSYYWSGKDYIGFVADHLFYAFSISGKMTYKVPVKKSNTTTLELAIKGERGDLLLHVADEVSWDVISLKKSRRLKQIALPYGEWTLQKVNGVISALGLTEKQFIRITDAGRKSMLINNVSNFITRIPSNQGEICALQQQNSLYLLSAEGKIISNFTTNVSEIEDVTILAKTNTSFIIALVDGISNNCYIYNTRGKKLNNKNLEGSSKVLVFQQTDGAVQLVSQANGYLIRNLINY